MTSSLKEKTVNGAIWITLGKIINFGVSFITGLVLARLLSPSDYGVIGMTTLFMVICSIFVDSGIGQSLIRKQDCTDEDYSTAYIYGIVVAFVCYLCLFIAAPYIADFYNEPVLSSVLRVLGLTIIIGSLGAIHGTIFIKKLDFKTPTKMGFLTTLPSLAFGIILAYQGFGVWSLVYQSLFSSVLNLILMHFFSKWRPKFIFSKRSFKDIFSFGTNMLITALIDVVYNNLYPIIIGKFFSSASLGYYAKGRSWAELPSMNLSGIVSSVCYPALSAIPNDDVRLREAYRRMIKFTAFLVFPVTLLILAVAKPLIIVTFTAKWIPSIPILQVLCLSLMWYPIHLLNLDILKVKGRSDLFLRLEIIKKFVGVSILLVSSHFGVIGMCWGGVLSCYISLFINTYYTKKLLNYGIVSQLKDLLPIIIQCVVMLSLAHFSYHLFDSVYIQLIVGIFVGVSIFLVISYITKSEELKECSRLFNRFVVARIVG